MRNKFTVVTAIFEDVIGFGLLKIVATNLFGGNLRGNRQHRYTIAMTVVETIDEQLRVARPSAAGADREIAGLSASAPAANAAASSLRI